MIVRGIGALAGCADVTLRIVEVAGGDVELDIDPGTPATVLEIRGFLVEDAVRADRGTLSGLSCGSIDFQMGGTVYAELVIKAGSQKRKLRGDRDRHGRRPGSGGGLHLHREADLDGAARNRLLLTG